MLRIWYMVSMDCLALANGPLWMWLQNNFLFGVLTFSSWACNMLQRKYNAFCGFWNETETKWRRERQLISTLIHSVSLLLLQAISLLNCLLWLFKKYCYRSRTRKPNALLNDASFPPFFPSQIAPKFGFLVMKHRKGRKHKHGGKFMQQNW